MTRLLKVGRWLVLVLIPAVGFGVFISLGRPTALGASTLLEPSLLAMGQLVGLILSVWLLATQLLYTLAIVTRTGWLAEILRPITLPMVRRVAAGLATVALSFSNVSARAQTVTEPTLVTIDPSSLRQEATPTPVLEPLVQADATYDCSFDEPAGSYSSPLTWLVRPGDHLWRIAGEHLTIVLDRAPTRDEHARYWVEVIDAAGPVIRSRNPDLIFPGEEIPLPPTLDAGVRP